MLTLLFERIPLIFFLQNFRQGKEHYFAIRFEYIGMSSSHVRYMSMLTLVVFYMMSTSPELSCTVCVLPHIYAGYYLRGMGSHLEAKTVLYGASVM